MTASKTASRPPLIDRRAIPAHAVESRWLADDGHAIRRIDWPLHAAGTATGSILFMPGRGDIYEKYLETLEYWHRAGWNVTSSDWRYQADSGRGTRNEHVGHIDNFEIWVDDFVRLWQLWKADRPGPHIIAAHSMGGHLTARALVESRIDPAGLILSAPMLAMQNAGMPDVLAKVVARFMCRISEPARPAWKVSEKPGSPLRLRQKLLTHDNDRYDDEIAWWAQRPQLVMGPSSWHWVKEAHRSIEKLFEPGGMEKVQTPVLLLGTSADALVSWKAIRNAAARFPNGRLVSYGREARHEILREADLVRDDVLAEIDAFLDSIAAPR